MKNIFEQYDEFIYMVCIILLLPIINMIYNHEFINYKDEPKNNYTNVCKIEEVIYDNDAIPLDITKTVRLLITCDDEYCKVIITTID